MAKKVKTILWFAVALLAIAFLVHRTPADTFRQAISDLRWSWAMGALLLYLVAQTFLGVRWVLLLRVHQVYISHFQAIKLTYLGLFYNNMMPGSVGGDLLKGWYITRHSQRHLRLEAAVTVFIDRLVGLIGMIMVGSIASLFVGGQTSYQGMQIRWLIWAILGMMILVSVIFLSRHVRQALMISLLLQKLPFARRLRQIDEAIRIYRNHLRVLLLSLLLTALIQGLAVVAVWMLTQSLHLYRVSLWDCLIIMPITWVISAAIPVPGGLGIIENCVTYLFCLVINPDNPNAAIGPAAALALLIRLMVSICSLPGALVPLFGGHLPKASQMEREMLNDNSREKEIAAAE